MELYHALEWGNVRDIWYMLERGRAGDVYRLFGPALEDMLGIQGVAEWLDFIGQEGAELAERPLCLYLAAWQHRCLKLDGYEGDVTERLMAFFQKWLPEALAEKIERTPVILDLDEPAGELELLLEPYRKQLEPAGYRLQVFFDDTYCAGVYFVFLETPKPWKMETK